MDCVSSLSVSTPAGIRDADRKFIVWVSRAFRHETGSFKHCCGPDITPKVAPDRTGHGTLRAWTRERLAAHHEADMLTTGQKGVRRGAVTGLVVTAGALGLAIAIAPGRLLPHDTSPLVFALAWDTAIMVCLVINIAMVAHHRFFTPEDIDGGGLTAGTARVRLLQSMLQNTLEQAVLAVGVHLIWAGVMPISWQAAVPTAAILFAVGRLLFWHGYASGAPSRALGFGLTFYPSVALLALIVGRLVIA